MVFRFNAPSRQPFENPLFEIFHHAPTKWPSIIFAFSRVAIPQLKGAGAYFRSEALFLNESTQGGRGDILDVAPFR